MHNSSARTRTDEKGNEGMQREAIKNINGRTCADVLALLPDELDGGRRVEKIGLGGTKICVRVRKHSGQGGRDSKGFVLNRYLVLDEFFFENLGLWEGEGGKRKGLYFGNNCTELLLHFLRFAERLGLDRSMFNVTINTPDRSRTYDSIKNEWSERLGIPRENFTGTCVDDRINREYAQMYVNGIVLSELMNALQNTLAGEITSHPEFGIPYLRGVFAAEGSVVLKPSSGVLFHIDFSNSMESGLIAILKACLDKLNIAHGKYTDQGKKFPIYGRRNFEKIAALQIHTLHPDKRAKFERGLGCYTRNVMKGDEMEMMIIEQFKTGPKTYDDLAASLKKGRSTIQSHYIPILERKGLIKRSGKRGRAWQFEMA